MQHRKWLRPAQELERQLMLLESLLLHWGITWLADPRSERGGSWVSLQRRRRSLLNTSRKWWLLVMFDNLATFIKVAEMTLCWATPWSGGIAGLSWVRWFQIWHVDLSLQVAQGLRTWRAKSLCPENVNNFYTSLENVYVLQTTIAYSRLWLIYYKWVHWSIA